MATKNYDESSRRFSLSESTFYFQVTRDENHPLLTLMETRPHSMDLMVKVKSLKPETMVRLLYERVPRIKQPYLHHLDDPVIEIFR